MGKGKAKGDVAWYVPKRKTPLVWSTTSASDLISLLSTEYETIRDVYNAITYDQEAKEVLKKYIEKGYGETIAKYFFR